MRVRAEIRLQEDAALARLGLGADARRAIRWGEGLVHAAEPFTPRRTGALLRSARVQAAPDGAEVRYTAPYAARVYRGLGPGGRPLRYTGAPQRGADWIRRTIAAGVWKPE